MASNQANTRISLNEESAFSASGKQVPAALSMMVDSMVRMIQKARSHQEKLDDLESPSPIDDN